MLKMRKMYILQMEKIDKTGSIKAMLDQHNNNHSRNVMKIVCIFRVILITHVLSLHMSVHTPVHPPFLCPLGGRVGGQG